MSLNIILAVDALSPNLTGIGRYTWQLTHHLRQRTDITSLHFYRNGKWIDEPEKLLLQPAISNELRGHIQSNRFLHAPNPLIKWPKSLKSLHSSITKFACRKHIFHGPNFFIPELANVSVATVHDLSIFKYRETHPAARLVEFEKHFQKSMDRATHLITDSEATRREVIEFLAWPSTKITAVPLGVSESFRQIPEIELKDVLSRYGLSYKGFCLCTSTLEPRKKIAQLLLAYQRLPISLRTQHPLILVGGAGWLSEQLHADIKRLSEQGWLKYLGFVPQQDLPALYAASSTFIFPSIYEGFGLPVLEAMASGVPVVASPFTSLPEVTQGSALLVDPDDVDALVSAIHRSLVDEKWRRTAVSSGLAVAQTFSWERCVDETIKVYQSISG